MVSDKTATGEEITGTRRAGIGKPLKLYLAGSFLIFSFLFLVTKLKLPKISKEVFVSANKALAILRSETMDDFSKEKAMQKIAGSLFIALFKILTVAAVSFMVPCSILFLLQFAKILVVEHVFQATISFPFTVIISFAAIIVFSLIHRMKY